MKEQKNIILQSKAGYFLRFAIEEIPEKKKGAIGVRGMRLSEGDSIEAVYYTRLSDETSIPYKSRELVLNQIKAAKRDGKGIKAVSYTHLDVYKRQSENNGTGKADHD